MEIISSSFLLVYEWALRILLKHLNSRPIGNCVRVCMIFVVPVVCLFIAGLIPVVNAFWRSIWKFVPLLILIVLCYLVSIRSSSGYAIKIQFVEEEKRQLVVFISVSFWYDQFNFWEQIIDSVSSNLSGIIFSKKPKFKVRLGRRWFLQ